jgi:hypothetical protein
MVAENWPVTFYFIIHVCVTGVGNQRRRFHELDREKDINYTELSKDCLTYKSIPAD